MEDVHGALQSVADVADQVNVDCPPGEIEVGFATRESTKGGGRATVTWAQVIRQLYWLNDTVPVGSTETVTELDGDELLLGKIVSDTLLPLAQLCGVAPMTLRNFGFPES